MSGDKIHVKKDKDTKKAIDGSYDFETIKNWPANQPNAGTVPMDILEDIPDDNPSTSQPQA